MSDIGINVGINFSSNGADQVTSQLDRMKRALSDITGITDEGQLDDYLKNKASGVEDRIKLADKISEIERRINYVPRNRDNVIPFPGRGLFAAERMARGTISGLGYDAAGAAISAGEGLLSHIGSIWTKLPMPAKIGSIAGMATVGGLAVGDALSKQYEAIVPQLIETTAALQNFGKTAREQSQMFRETMERISGSASEYGYTFRQGADITRQVALGVSRTETAEGLANQVMRMSSTLGYAAPSEELASLAAMGERFGMKENAAGYALGSAMNVPGIGSHRARDQAGALLSMFQGNLGRGVVSDMKKLARTQNWLYGTFGERAMGQGGATAYSGLSNAQAGATGLRSEADMLLFQAAREGDEDYTKAMERLEGGFDEKIFERFKKSISGSDWASRVELTRKAYGVEYKTAADMLRAGSADKAKAYWEEEGPGKAIPSTSEKEITKYQEQIANNLREFGASFTDYKAGLLRGVDKIVDILTGGQVKGMLEREKDQASLGYTNPIPLRQFSVMGLERVINASKSDISGAGSSVLSLLTEDAQKKLGDYFASSEGAGTLRDIHDIEMSDKLKGWSEGELKLVFEKLKTTLDELTKAVKSPGTFTVNGDPPRSPYLSPRMRD